MGRLPSLQALKQKLKRLLGKTPDGNTDLEKSWKRQQNSQAQVYEELFSSEISSVLRHWERKGGLEFRDDFQLYKNCNDQEGMKWSPGSSPPPPLPPRSNAHGIAHPLTAHQEDILMWAIPGDTDPIPVVDFQSWDATMTRRISSSTKTG